MNTSSYCNAFLLQILRCATMAYASQSCFFILFVICQFFTLHGSDHIKPYRGETCSADNGEGNPCSGLYSESSDVRLPRRDAVAVGHEQTIKVDKEKSVQLKTRSVKPPIFEIPDLLSSEECDHLVDLAQSNGMEQSETAKGAGKQTVTREVTDKTLTEEQMNMYCRRIRRYDKDKDGNITMSEFAGFVYHITRMLVRTNDLWLVYKTLLPEGAQVITYENCTKVNRTQFVEFVYQLFNIKRLPYYKARHSEHSWVDLNDEDPFLKRLKRRIAAITQISVWQIDHSESLQVVQYKPGGHYHAHYDSTVASDLKDKRCCGTFEDVDKSACLLCRYITILFFLNNVTEGGEIAFPVADHPELLTEENYSPNLSKSCEKASLVVKPVKGSALFWYNNVLDEKTGEMGEVDMLSLHGGCDIITGEKWVANLWINAPRGDQTV